MPDPDDADTTESNSSAISAMRLFATLQDDHADAFGGSAAKDYHAYCTRKLSRLRHHHAVRTALVHNPRYVTTTTTTTDNNESSGTTENASSKKANPRRQRRHAYATRTMPEVHESPANDHPNVLWNLVYQAQRCGAHARELMSSSSSSSAATTGGATASSSSQHVRRRLRKAVHYAQALMQQVEHHQTTNHPLAAADATFRTECQAYLHFCQGQLALSQNQHTQAAQYYQTCVRIILQDLVNAHHTDDNSPQAIRLRDIWTTWAEGTVRPLLRYCQYESNSTVMDVDGGNDDTTTTTTSMQQQQSSSGDGLSVSFVGREISLQGFPQLSVHYLKLKDAKIMSNNNSGDTNENEDTDFVHHLDDLDLAHSLVQSCIRDYQGLPDGPAVAAKRDDLKALDAYFSVRKLECQRQHQEERIISSNNDNNSNDTTTAANVVVVDPSSRVHAYASLLHLVQSALDRAAEFADANHNDDDFLLLLQAHVVRLRTHRAYWMARALLEENSNGISCRHPAYALQLVQLGRKLCHRAVEELQACEDDSGDDNNNNNSNSIAAYLQGLQALDFDTVECRAKIGLALQDLGAPFPTATTSANSDMPLWQRDWDVMMTNGIGTMTLEPTPIPPKHVTCDVAGSLLLQASTPDWSAMDKVLHPEATTKSKGLLGWFKS